MSSSRYRSRHHGASAEGTHTACSAAIQARNAWRRLCTRTQCAGQGLVEYALMLMLIAIVVIGSVSLLGNQVSSTFDQVNCRFSGGTYHTDNGNGNSSRCQGAQGNGNG